MMSCYVNKRSSQSKEEPLVAVCSQIMGDGFPYLKHTTLRLGYVHNPTCKGILTVSGFPLYLENLEFCHFLFQAWKMHGICSKSGKNLEF